MFHANYTYFPAYSSRFSENSERNLLYIITRFLLLHSLTEIFHISSAVNRSLSPNALFSSVFPASVALWTAVHVTCTRFALHRATSSPWYVPTLLFLTQLPPVSWSSSASPPPLAPPPRCMDRYGLALCFCCGRPDVVNSSR